MWFPPKIETTVNVGFVLLFLSFTLFLLSFVSLIFFVFLSPSPSFYYFALVCTYLIFTVSILNLTGQFECQTPAEERPGRTCGLVTMRLPEFAVKRFLSTASSAVGSNRAHSIKIAFVHDTIVQYSVHVKSMLTNKLLFFSVAQFLFWENRAKLATQFLLLLLTYTLFISSFNTKQRCIYCDKIFFIFLRLLMEIKTISLIYKIFWVWIQLLSTEAENGHGCFFFFMRCCLVITTYYLVISCDNKLIYFIISI